METESSRRRMQFEWLSLPYVIPMRKMIVDLENP